MKGKYFMTAETDKTMEILIYGEITSWEWQDSDMSAYTLARLIQKSGAENINVRINSCGGEVAEGLAIYNSLKNHPAKVTTICDGFACSAASVVFMAGDERIVNDASLLMIHNAWSFASGNAEDLRKAAGDLDKISNAAAEAYRRVMMITEEELQQMLKEETWILPQEALTYGFATSINTGNGTGSSPQYSARRAIFDLLKPLYERKPEPSKAADPINIENPGQEGQGEPLNMFHKFKK